jgi:allantoinase
MIVARLMGAEEFADLIVDNFDEMLLQSRDQPLVMGIALHPYIVGQPYRLRHLRRALKHITRNGKKAWFTTPGKICDFVSS